jgi:hypothetical protein
MAAKRKRNCTSAPLPLARRPILCNPTHTRASPAYVRHQRIASDGSLQDAGEVVHAPPRLEQVMLSSWDVTTSLLQNPTLREYHNLRLSCRIMTYILLANIQGQTIPATVNLLARCQNVRTYPQPQYLRYPDNTSIPFPRRTPLGPGAPCPYNNPGSTVLLHRCAGYQLGLHSAVGSNGHGSDYWVCEKCVSDSFHAFDFTDWLPHRIVKICAPCANTLRANNQGELPNFVLSMIFIRIFRFPVFK